MSGDRYRSRVTNALTGAPLPDEVQDAYLRQVVSTLAAQVAEHPEYRRQVELWLPRGVAVLTRCAVCVRNDASMEESLRIPGTIFHMHVPDGARPDGSDRLALYLLCRAHLGVGEIGPQVASAVRWWATWDGALTPGRVVVFLPPVERAGA